MLYSYRCEGATLRQPRDHWPQGMKSTSDESEPPLTRLTQLPRQSLTHHSSGLPVHLPDLALGLYRWSSIVLGDFHGEEDIAEDF